MPLPKIKTAILLIMALMLCMGAFSFKVYASEGGGEALETVVTSASYSDGIEEAISLVVGASWLDGDMLRIDVTDEHTGEQTSIALRLSDHMSPNDNSPYISIQAMDELGSQSGVIQIRNPFYVPDGMPDADNLSNMTTDMNLESAGTEAYPEPTSVGSRPLTPDGTGTVIDNVTDADGIEFFTVFSEDGNEFFLIVDRQRNSDNVYLLNTVTEEDLISLARNSGREISPTDPNFSGVLPSQTHPSDLGDESDADDEPEEYPPATPVPSNNNLVLILVVVALVGAAAYYFKIYKNKQSDSGEGSYDEDDSEDDEENDWDYEYEIEEGGGADDQKD